MMTALLESMTTRPTQDDAPGVMKPPADGPGSFAAALDISAHACAHAPNAPPTLPDAPAMAQADAVLAATLSSCDPPPDAPPAAKLVAMPLEEDVGRGSVPSPFEALPEADDQGHLRAAPTKPRPWACPVTPGRVHPATGAKARATKPDPAEERLPIAAFVPAPPVASPPLDGVLTPSFGDAMPVRPSLDGPSAAAMTPQAMLDDRLPPSLGPKAPAPGVSAGTTFDANAPAAAGAVPAAGVVPVVDMNPAPRANPGANVAAKAPPPPDRGRHASTDLSATPSAGKASTPGQPRQAGATPRSPEVVQPGRAVRDAGPHETPRHRSSEHLVSPSRAQADGPEPTEDAAAPDEDAAPVAARAEPDAQVDPSPAAAVRAPELLRRDAPAAAVEGRAMEDARDAQTPDRHAAAVAVSRMTLQRAAHAEVEIPELGRIAVTARTREREVDVTVSASAQSLDVLRAAGGELSASLREASIPLGSLHIGADGAGGGAWHSHSGDAERRRDRAGEQPEQANPAPGAAPSRRVRIVL